LKVHGVTADAAVAHVLDCLDRRIGGWVMTPNVDILRRWVRNQSFRATTAGVTLCVPDGMPLVWASRLCGTPLAERVTGADLTQSLIAAAAARGKSVYLLGGAPGTAVEAASAMRRAHPQLRVAGTYFPPYGFENDPRQWDSMAEAIGTAQPDMVFVGLGSPKQEYVIQRLRGLLPASWWLGIGVTFSFLSGQLSRAPQWMQRCGLEWLFRLMCEPKRLARRYLVDDLPFAASLLAHAAGRAASLKFSQDRAAGQEPCCGLKYESSGTS
jgi:N-acetylglucosaminyldiphosphoundecaprenol N-acetyl-beta-D-mannosaminyltransferase